MAAIDNSKAAWLPGAGERISVSSGPDQTTVADDEVVVKVAYVAVNPVDWKVQDWNVIPLKYPHVLGTDVAGEVVLVGDKVTRFKKGDRVMGYCLGLVYGSKHGSFQTYTTLRERVTSLVPASMDLSHAVVLPMAISTSICGLYEHLKLRQPNVDNTQSGGTLVIWGASSSIAAGAVQLARAAGYEVIATASPKNFEYAKALGCAEVFDYRDPDVVDLVGKRLSGTTFAGIFDTIGEESSARACAEILSKQGGGTLSVTLPPPADLPANVHAENTWATNPGTVDDHVAAGVWRDFVPAALERGLLKAKPDPVIISGGLEKLQEAMDLQKKGVSAAKVVVQL